MTEEQHELPNGHELAIGYIMLAGGGVGADDSHRTTRRRASSDPTSRGFAPLRPPCPRDQH